MEELQIITNKITPAKVEFNYKAIDEQLDVVLRRYKGLVFTEDTATDCKKTIAELRKGQKALDEFRKKTKRELTQSVTKFEDDCKYLYKKFDTVIDPLKDQADKFEQQRKEEKRQIVETMIEDVKEKFNLNQKYGNELVVEDKYLNASESISKIKEQLYINAEYLREQQRKEQADIDLIKKTVKNNNYTNDLNLLEDNYLRLLSYEDAASIVAKIYEDSAKLLKAQEEERMRIAEQEAQKKAKEEEEQRLLEQAEIVHDMAVEESDQTVYIETPESFDISDFYDLPTEIETITKTFRVTGTPEQMKDLEIFLNAIFEKWEEGVEVGK